MENLMAPSESPQPTPAQLQVLRVLWDRGPSTCRDVHNVLGPRNDVGYTTILKIMQVMAEKGLVVRDEENRSHVYEANVSEAETQQALVRDLIDRAFEGSTAELVLQALSAKPASKQDLAQIQAMIARANRRAR
jgi:predicted transcriptional regulator